MKPCGGRRKVAWLQSSVYFGNGNVNLVPEYKPQLMKLAEKTKIVRGYMTEITGYASSVGSPAVN